MRRAPRIVRAAVARFSRTRWFRRNGPRFMPGFERLLDRLTGGRIISSGVVVPSLVLHTTGAKSGEPRDTHLVYCPSDAGSMLVAGSNFGRERHPAWTFNLLACPDAAVTLRGRRIPVSAEPIADADRDRIWAELEDNLPGYREYERASGRVVRIFRLMPVEGD